MKLTFALLLLVGFGCNPELRRRADCSIFVDTGDGGGDGEPFDAACCEAKAELCRKRFGRSCNDVCEG